MISKYTVLYFINQKELNKTFPKAHSLTHERNKFYSL